MFPQKVFFCFIMLLKPQSSLNRNLGGIYMKIKKIGKTVFDIIPLEWTHEKTKIM